MRVFSQNVQAEATQAGFLVAIWKVKEVLENPGDTPAYPKDDYRYRVVADSVPRFTLMVRSAMGSRAMLT